MTYVNALAIIDPTTNEIAWVDPFNSARQNPGTHLTGSSFVLSTKDTRFWAETLVGSGTVTQSNGEVTLATGVTANSTVQYQTVRVGNYVPGTENIFRTALKLGNTGVANNVRRWGYYNAANGVFFELSGTSLRVVTRLNSVDSPIAQASWNGTNTFVLDTNYHSYDIRVTTLRVLFYIDKVLVHTFALTTALPSATFNLNCTMQSVNSGGLATNQTIICAMSLVSRTGQLVNEAKPFHIAGAATTVLKSSPGKLQSIVVNGGGTSATVYDNTAGSGAVIAVINLSANPTTLIYNAPFEIGLTIVTVGAGTDLSVLYE